MIKFTWDNSKNEANIKKHGVSFEEAVSVFDDTGSLIMFDEVHSTADEDRFLIIGVSYKIRVLLVCHCYRENETVVRIISARKADFNERNAYATNDERLLRFLQSKKESIHKTSQKTGDNKSE